MPTSAIWFGATIVFFTAPTSSSWLSFFIIFFAVSHAPTMRSITLSGNWWPTVQPATAEKKHCSAGYPH
jgi:hypothetical protein